MRVIPVLDLMNGLVVRGIAGRRDEYRPIVSRLTASSRPFEIARAYREHFGFTDLYLADLDAIAGQPPALDLYAALRDDGFRLWIDAGIRCTADGDLLAAAGVDCIIAGLETLAGPAVLTELCRRSEEARVAFSLDLRNGRPLGDCAAWQAADPVALAGQAVSCGARRLIVLDLARVGVGSGTGTEDLCRRLSAKFQGIELLAGGGVNSAADLQRLQQCGVAGVLVASALHDGRLGRADLASGAA
jgi:phosphoribosylformimino-5-aminoimidazole carboxamide ribotide isomerase